MKTINKILFFTTKTCFVVSGTGDHKWLSLRNKNGQYFTLFKFS